MNIFSFYVVYAIIEHEHLFRECPKNAEVMSGNQSEETYIEGFTKVPHRRRYGWKGLGGGLTPKPRTSNSFYMLNNLLENGVNPNECLHQGEEGDP